ncbi:SGNH/GDSL hydrolase family protein [Agrococcus citreus]|uniref:SGNH hydrolase-type esterase domain-containing protein n=1 Tax=Agrococcus citreus TaxID=84643 RepID=A0ABP4JGD9_9MICO
MTRRRAPIATAIVATLLAVVTACAQAPTPTPSTPTHPTAVFIGDSYTVGTGTSLAGTDFPAILGDLRDWNVQNLAIAGTGYSTGQPDGLCPASGCNSYVGVLPAAVAADPDIVVVSGGRNDLNRLHLERPVTVFYTELRRQRPEARLVVTSPLWDDSPLRMRSSPCASRSSARQTEWAPSTSTWATCSRTAPT